MHCLSVLYPNQPDAAFDLGYYVETHMRLVQDRLAPGGLLRFELEDGRAGWPPTEPAPFVMICTMYFESREALEHAFGAHGDELIADIRAYTNIKPRMQISEILPPAVPHEQQASAVSNAPASAEQG